MSGGHDIEVTATAGGKTLTQEITINITDVDEPPVFTSPEAFTVAEGPREVGTVRAPDPDFGDRVSLSMSGGADQSRFTIDPATGAPTFNGTPNFEGPEDLDRNNRYEIEIIANSNEQSVTQTVTVIVSNVNEAPKFTSPERFTIAEGNTEVVTVTAFDPDPADTIGFALSGGADQSLFVIDATTGDLTFNTAPDFEHPTDANGDNDYEVQITATAGNYTLTGVITVIVTP